MFYFKECSTVVGVSYRCTGRQQTPGWHENRLLVSRAAGPAGWHLLSKGCHSQTPDRHPPAPTEIPAHGEPPFSSFNFSIQLHFFISERKHNRIWLYGILFWGFPFKWNIEILSHVKSLCDLGIIDCKNDIHYFPNPAMLTPKLAKLRKINEYVYLESLFLLKKNPGRKQYFKEKLKLHLTDKN